MGKCYEYTVLLSTIHWNNVKTDFSILTKFKSNHMTLGNGWGWSAHRCMGTTEKNGLMMCGVSNFVNVPDLEEQTIHERIGLHFVYIQRKRCKMTQM